MAVPLRLLLMFLFPRSRGCPNFAHGRSDRDIGPFSVLFRFKKSGPFLRLRPQAAATSAARVPRFMIGPEATSCSCSCSPGMSCVCKPFVPWTIVDLHVPLVTVLDRAVHSTPYREKRERAKQLLLQFLIQQSHGRRSSSDHKTSFVVGRAGHCFLSFCLQYETVLGSCKAKHLRH